MLYKAFLQLRTEFLVVEFGVFFVEVHYSGDHAGDSLRLKFGLVWVQVPFECFCFDVEEDGAVVECFSPLASLNIAKIKLISRPRYLFVFSYDIIATRGFGFHTKSAECFQQDLIVD